MQNQVTWAPTKFVYRKGALRASRDKREVGVGSRLAADLVATFYDVYLPRYARGRLVDLGCGQVPLFEAYRDHVASVVCVDWERTFHSTEHVDVYCDLGATLPFEDEQFDTILLSDVLEHIPGPERLWAEMSRILSRGGHLIMNVPFCYWLHEEPHDYYRYTEFALRRFVEDSGLELVLLRPIGGTPEVLADILAKHLVRVPVLGGSLSAAIQAVTLGLVRTKLGQRASTRTAAKLPLGYFLIATKLGNALA